MTDEDKSRSEATLRLEIRDFSKLKERILSPASIVRGLPWQIMVVPRTLAQAKCLGVFLTCYADDLFPTWTCRAEAVLRLVSQKEGVPHLEREFATTFYPENNDHGCRCLERWHEITDPDKGYIKDDVVILEVSVKADAPCGIKTKSGQFLRKVEQLKGKSVVGVGAISSRSLFPLVIDPAATKESLCDVTLVCQDVSFNCHKIILAQASTTFRTMFTGNFVEGNNSPVSIDDISVNTLLEILRFIYCGYIDTDVTQATLEVQHEFLYAAEKYDLSSLLDLLVTAFEESLTADTACRYLVFADRFSLTDLKKLCFEVMHRSTNREKVHSSPEWEQYAGNKQLVSEFYRFRL